MGAWVCTRVHMCIGCALVPGWFQGGSRGAHIRAWHRSVAGARPVRGRASNRVQEQLSGASIGAWRVRGHQSSGHRACACVDQASSVDPRAASNPMPSPKKLQPPGTHLRQVLVPLQPMHSILAQPVLTPDLSPQPKPYPQVESPFEGPPLEKTHLQQETSAATSFLHWCCW